MKMKNWLRRAAAGALCLILCACALSQTAFAVRAPSTIQDFDPNKDCKMTLRYLHEGVEVKLYKVATVDQDLRFTLTGDFRELAPFVDLDREKSAGDWKVLAQWLKSCVTDENTRDRFTPIQEGKTVSDGRGEGVITFDKDKEGKALKPGLYLVVTQRYVRETPDKTHNLVERTVYTVDPYLVSLPTWEGESQEDGRWIYEIDGEAGKKAAEEELKDHYLMAVKVWHNSSGNPIAPPEDAKITLVLKKDGVTQLDTKRTLPDEKGNWYCVWEGLSSEHEWTVEEISGHKDYTCKVEEVEGNGVKYSFQVTNTKKGPPYEPNPSLPPVYPTPSPRPSDFEVDDPTPPLGDMTPPPGSSAPPRGTQPPEEIELDDPDVPLGDLPQTGQLWWPVPILAVAGLILLLVGLIRRRIGGYDDE